MDMVGKDVISVWRVGLGIQIVSHVNVHRKDPPPQMEFVMLKLESVPADGTLMADNVKPVGMTATIIPTASVSKDKIRQILVKIIFNI